MKKKLLMIVLIVMSIGLISGVFIMKIGNRELKIENANDNVVQEKEKDKESIQEKEPEELEKVDEEKDSSKEDKTDYKNNTKVETNDTSSTINAEKEESNKTPAQPDNNTSVVEKTEWEKLGISEYEFYNSPAWNWQNVDFGINLTDDKKCNNETECLTKCQNYGEEYIKTHSGGYRCTNVLSYSGKYLGEDFEYFELQP